MSARHVPVNFGPPSILRFSLVLFVVVGGLLAGVLYATRKAPAAATGQPASGAAEFPGWRKPPAK